MALHITCLQTGVVRSEHCLVRWYTHQFQSIGYISAYLWFVFCDPVF